MKILILSLIAFNSFASISTEYAKGQDPSLGSFYLKSNRTKFRNPGKTDDTEDSIYLESRGEIDFKKDVWAFALGRQVQGEGVIDAFYHAGIGGFSGYLSPHNGEGIKTWGAAFGVDIPKEFAFYVGIHDTPEQKITPKFGLALDFIEGSLFGEFYGQIFSPEFYDFTIGYGREYKNFFGDISYHQTNEELRELTANLGAKFKLAKEFYLIGSGKAELFFNPLFSVVAGIQWQIEDFEISAAHSLSVLDKDHPEYKNFNLDLSVAYFF